MVALYVVSSEEAAGKTTICAGLGRYLHGSGKKAGFLKPVVAGKNGADSDAAFMKQVLGMSEAAAALCPPADDIGKVKRAYDQVARGKDVIIVEGRLGQGPADTPTRLAYDTAKSLEARVMAVAAYSGQALRFIDVYQGFGKNLLGVVLNKVPKSQLKRAQDETAKHLAGAGIGLLGALPEDRVLFAITVGELAESIQGKILNNAEKSAELVENFMLGAMVVDSGRDYFGRKINKAAIVRGDRPDMQLAALETPTRCLVLSGSSQVPIYNVLEKAENRGIPIISSENTTSDIVTKIEEALAQSKFNQEKKLARLAEIMKQHLDLKVVL